VATAATRTPAAVGRPHAAAALQQEALTASLARRGTGSHPAPPGAAKASAAKPTAPKAAPAAKRWLPTGTGMWIYEWHKSNHGSIKGVVARAKHTGLTHLFVRTGSTHDGFTGARLLRSLLPTAQAAHLKIVAWDFPELQNPVADARRMAHAARIVARGGARVAAVAPDIETRAEGTRSTPARIRLYLHTLRRLLPHDVSILATVPWPSRSRIGHYSYSTVAHGSDALLPMAYWYDNEPTTVTARSMSYLRRFARPVMPVGQGYDGRIDVPSLPHNNLRVQVPAFLATAHRFGAQAVSLWSWQASPKTAWTALRRAHRLFPVR
jgi:hypothetical protein